MLFVNGGPRLLLVVVVIAVALGTRPAEAAEDMAKAVERQVGEPVRVTTHDGLGFPKKVRGVRADSRFEADFDNIFEEMRRTGKWPLTSEQVHSPTRFS